MTIARKRHVCSWCEEPIEPGETYHREVVWTDDGPVKSKLHPECRVAANAMPIEARWALEDGAFWPFEHMRRGAWVEDP